MDEAVHEGAEVTDVLQKVVDGVFSEGVTVDVTGKVSAFIGLKILEPEAGIQVLLKLLYAVKVP